MKRIISLLLSICLILGLFPVTVKADEVQTKYLKVFVNEDEKMYECLWDNEEIYCSVGNLAEITNYDWVKMEDSLEYQFFREYDELDNYAIEIQTSVTISVDKDKAEIEAMDESYTVNCYFVDDELFLPLEKLLYLLHAEWVVNDDTVYVTPMPLTILDFLAIHQMDLVKIASQSEDVLINTGWLLSDTKIGQAVYSSIAEVFNDFDGKIFMLWWPGEGHVETAESYENAILQLAKEDKEFVGEEVQQDALEVAANSVFYLGNAYMNKIQNIMAIPENIDDIVQSVPDAVELLEDMGKDVSKFKDIAEDIKDGTIDTLFLSVPEVKSKTQELEAVGDGLALLQCVWNTYDTATRVKNWNDEYLAQLQVLADYQEFESINDSVANYVRSSAQRLIDSYQNPSEAAANEAIQSTMGLLLSKTLDASPFGKAFSIMNAVGSCYGVFDVDTADTYDMYAELSVVTFSVKIEQMVKYLLDYNNLLYTTDKLTEGEIEDYRNQLMLYLRLNLRNKKQLYDLNIAGNKDKNWKESEEAKALYDEIVLVYTMLAELIETKDYDSFIPLDNDWDVFNSADRSGNVISGEILIEPSESKLQETDDYKTNVEDVQFLSYKPYEDHKSLVNIYEYNITGGIYKKNKGYSTYTLLPSNLASITIPNAFSSNGHYESMTVEIREAREKRDEYIAFKYGMTDINGSHTNYIIGTGAGQNWNGESRFCYIYHGEEADYRVLESFVPTSGSVGDGIYKIGLDDGSVTEYISITNLNDYSVLGYKITHKNGKCTIEEEIKTPEDTFSDFTEIYCSNGTNQSLYSSYDEAIKYILKKLEKIGLDNRIVGGNDISINDLDIIPIYVEHRPGIKQDIPLDTINDVVLQDKLYWGVNSEYVFVGGEDVETFKPESVIGVWDSADGYYRYIFQSTGNDFAVTYEGMEFAHGTIQIINFINGERDYANYIFDGNEIIMVKDLEKYNFAFSLDGDLMQISDECFYRVKNSVAKKLTGKWENDELKIEFSSVYEVIVRDKTGYRNDSRGFYAVLNDSSVWIVLDASDMDILEYSINGTELNLNGTMLYKEGSGWSISELEEILIGTWTYNDEYYIFTADGHFEYYTSEYAYKYNDPSQKGVYEILSANEILAYDPATGGYFPLKQINESGQLVEGSSVFTKID